MTSAPTWRPEEARQVDTPVSRGDQTIHLRLQESELRLKLALRAADIGIWDWNLQTNEMTFTAKARAIFGFAPDDLVTIDELGAITHPDDLPRTALLLKRSLDPEVREKAPFEYRIRQRRTGDERWVLAHGDAIFASINGVKTAVRYIGTIQDITDRKRRNEQLRQNEARLDLAIDAARMAVWELDVATETVKGNENLNRIFGFPRGARPTIEELRACYAPGERDRVVEAARSALAKGRKHLEMEFQCQRADGARRWLLLRAELITGADNRLKKAIGVLMDIDNQKRALAQQSLLIRELNHRVKNILALVQSLIGQTFRKGVANEESLGKFRERVQALAKANDVLVRSNWTDFRLKSLVDEITRAYRDESSDPFRIEGADLHLPPALNVPLALVLHELCTNAAKYGALSTDTGKIDIEWSASSDGLLTLSWKESGGPIVSAPQRTGFGTKLLTGGLAQQLGGIELSYQPGGVRCRVVTRLPAS